MYKKIIAISLLLFLMGACNNPSLPPGYMQEVQSIMLSSQDPNFRTCVFDPGKSVVYFPMYHRPSEGFSSAQQKEMVIRSQFQLLHTLVEYNRKLLGNIAVFDEYIVIDSYTPEYYRLLSQGLRPNDQLIHVTGKRFYLSERQQTAHVLFNRVFPQEYEALNPAQREFLWNTGATLTLYLLGELPQLYKVISGTEMSRVKQVLGNDFSFQNIDQNRAWTFTHRENQLRNEIYQFYQINPYYQGLIFIAYGALHDFSDDFRGWAFQSGRCSYLNCLNWAKSWTTPPSTHSEECPYQGLSSI